MGSDPREPERAKRIDVLNRIVGFLFKKPNHINIFFVSRNDFLFLKLISYFAGFLHRASHVRRKDFELCPRYCFI